MSSKENDGLPLSSLYTFFQSVKAEPVETKIAPLGASGSWQSDGSGSSSSAIKKETRPLVKPEFSEASIPVASTSTAVPQAYQPPQPAAPALPFNQYKDAAGIDYSPELALKEGLGMVKALKGRVTKLELGSKMRKDVWLRELAALETQGAPTTLIAICGATGTGKSSLLNAILDDNIVPTSGMRACTAVVTEIAYHNKPTIDADISFLTEAEWRAELALLLEDLLDEDGNLKRATDLRSEAGVAWHKVHAVYPTISQEQLVRMTVDQIMARDPVVAKKLGTVQRIVAKDSKTFSTEINKYIDSKDQKRGKDKDKKKDKDKQKKDKLDGPAFWPLIRQVIVHCNSKALETGAVLVDLPGVADANAARSSIAKDYMKKSDCVWVLAPITRAVDDKTAKDLLGDAFRMQLMNGNYDSSAITFIATKCDDISCSEVVNALNLHDDTELEEAEERIDQIDEQSGIAKANKAKLDKDLKVTGKQLKAVRALLCEYQQHLEALEKGEPFTPTLTAKKKRSSSRSTSPTSSPSKKRKSTGGGKKGSPKRRKTAPSESDVDDSMEEDDDADSFVVSDDEEEAKSGAGSGSDSDNDDDESKSNEEKDGEEDEDEEMEEEVTKEFLEAKISENKEMIKNLRTVLSEQRNERKKASDEVTKCKDLRVKAQREKNGICSLRRSDFSRDVLKEDFRSGLRELDEAAAQEKNPDEFDPTQNLRDYEAIDLPVYCVSARDYIRIKKQVKGDGDPACFTEPEKTGVPALRGWCRELTVSSRSRAARTFLTQLQAFSTSVRNYVQGITDVSEVDRKKLRDQWESLASDLGEDDDLRVELDFMDQDAWQDYVDGVYGTPKKTLKVDAYGNPIGVKPRLVREFQVIVDEAVKGLQRAFAHGLNEKLQVGAENAANSAVQISDEFAASMHWGTYRATLKRHGTFRRCLNTELINPLTRSIASSWARVFEGNLFETFQTSANKDIAKLVKDVENSAAAGLKDRTKTQGEQALEESKVAMANIVTVVREILNDQQKDISRSLVPHVSSELMDGYDTAMMERGRGSVARQKAIFHDFINEEKENVFDTGAEALMDKLDRAADAIGVALLEALEQLAEKVEVSLGVLWERPKDDPRQVALRHSVLNLIQVVDGQLANWMLAERDSSHQRLQEHAQ